MNTFTKIMFATSAAMFMTISTNSYSYGEGIGGRAIVVEQAKYETSRMVDNKQRQVEQVTQPARVEPTPRFTRGEGIGGRAIAVERAKYEANTVENQQRISGSIENAVDQI